MNSNKPYNRLDRINNQILDILSDIMMKNVDLSHLGFITFTSVDVAPDLRTAKIYYSVLSNIILYYAIILYYTLLVLQSIL